MIFDRNNKYSIGRNNVQLTVVVFWMISGSSLSSGTTSSTKRGTVGGAGGGARGVMAAFLALEKNLMYTENIQKDISLIFRMN